MPRELISIGDEDGALFTGYARQIISGVGATRTLLTKEAGALCLFDRAAGVVYTLPSITASNIGMTFEFMATVSVTTNAYKVVSAATATQFLVGGVTISSLTVAEAGDFFVANGTNIAAISEDGATKGGLIGGGYKVTAISLTQWAIKGVTCGAGTLADPFAAS